LYSLGVRVGIINLKLVYGDCVSVNFLFVVVFGMI